MATVPTVLGPVDATDLGPTLVHEHVYFSYPGDVFDHNSTWDRASCIDRAVERLQAVAEHGIRTVVDPTPIECGRDVELIAEVSQRSGVQIVCATGFYNEHIGIPYYWRVRSEEEIYELYMHELTQGASGTGIKPGIVKIASSDPVTDLERKVLRAGARAAKDAGVTVVSHCENATGWDVQIEILSDAGVDLGRCLIGHQDQAPNEGQVKEIANAGAMVGIDRIGYELLASEDARVNLIKSLLDSGEQERLCISLDHMCCLRSAKFPYAIPEGMEELLPIAWDQMYRPYTYLFTDFWPKLEAAGIDRTTFEKLLTDNPRRLFGG